MNQSLQTQVVREAEYSAATTFCKVFSDALFTRFQVGLWLLLGFFILGLFCGSDVQAQCSSSAPTTLVKWDFNSQTVQCNGAVSKGNGNLTAPFMLQGKNSYCPNINNGCGAAILGTKGFGNTFDFKNALCLAGFWRNDGGIYAAAPGWNLNDVTFKPEIPANLFISYVLPAGKAGSLTGFTLKVIQKQYNGTTPSFEKQGVGVYRNGVLIHTETQTIQASQVNGQAMTFTFPNTPDFQSDGSAEVTFEVTFGLVHRLSKISTGYDDICLLGTCGSGGSPIPTAAATPATCGPSSANADGKITLTNFGTSDHFDISMGNSYMGTQTYASAPVVPAGGVITSTLPNPASPQIYTVRVFTAAGCTTDLQVTLKPTVCPGVACTAPTATLNATPATCTGTSVNNNASIAVSGVSGGDRVALSPGSFYTGPAYAAAQTLTAGAYSFTALPNPNGSQVYTVRVFNAGDGCFKDFPVTLTETDCGCKKIGVQIVESDQGDPNSTPNNNLTTEDDYASYEVCKGTQFIDLKLAKTVSPNTGAICPTNTDFVWTMVLTNAGTMAATNIQVTDDMPGDLVITGVTFTSGDFTLAGGWLIPSLAAGTSTTLTITTKATKPGTYTNCAWINDAFPLNDPNSSPLNGNIVVEDDYACAVITVTGPNTPTIAKEFNPETAKTGVPFRITLKLTNNEALPITLTAPLVDNLPASPGQMVIAPTPNLNTALPGILATAGGTTITVPAGTVLVPGLNVIQVDVVAPVDGEYCNNIPAGALQTTSCANAAFAEACVIVKSDFVVGPLIKKTFSPEIVAAGQNSTLTITIENRNATGITLLQNFIDELPAGLVTAGAATGSCAGITLFSSTTQVGITSGSVIAPGICTITVPVQSNTAGDYCNTIIMNALIGNVSNGSIQVMTGNDDISTACLTVSPNPCTSLAITSLVPSTTTVAPGGTVDLDLNGTGFGASTLYKWTTGAFSNQGVSTTYTAPMTTGTYTLTVAADNRLTGFGACNDLRTLTVQVQDAPVCSLTATAQASSQSVCQGSSVTLTAQVSPAGSYTYVWAAPAGVTLAGASTTMATASNMPAGLNTFTVTVSSAPDCSTTATVSVQVNPATTLPTFQPSVLCEGDAVSFEVSVPVGASAYWTTPANTTISSGTVTIASATTADAGTYTLYYTNENGCVSAPATKQVTVNVKPTLSFVDSGCLSDNQSYTVLISTNATSLTTNAAANGVTINGNVITAPTTVALFTVTAFSAAGCFQQLDISRPVCQTVCTEPVISITPVSQTVCEGNAPASLIATLTSGTAVSYQWYGPSSSSAVLGVAISSANSLTYSPPASTTGIVYYAIVAQTSAGSVCSGSAVAAVTTQPRPGVVVSSTTLCAGQTIDLYSLIQSYTGGPSNTRVYDDLQAAQTGGTPISSTVSPTATTTYYFVTNAVADITCSSITSATVTVNPKPDAGADQTLVCGPLGIAPTSPVLTATPTGGVWSNVPSNPSVASFLPNSATTTVGNLAAGTYNFVYTVNGCTDTVTVTVPVCQTFCASLTVTASAISGTVCSGQPATLTAQVSPAGSYTYVWAAPAGVTLAGASTTMATASNMPAGLNTFTVTVSSSPGCATTATVSVFVGAPPVLNAQTICATDGLTYSITGTVSPATATVTDAASRPVISNAGSFTISGIPVGVNDVLTATSPEGCTATLPVAAPACQIPQFGSIGNYVWKDNNNNGLQDASEPGVADVTVELYTVTGGIRSTTPVATTVTSASGLYAFTGLVSGDYQVKFTLPNSLTGPCQITYKPNAGTDDTRDSDVDPATGLSPVITIDTTQPASSTARNNTTIDAGLQRKIYDPTGYIYCYKTNTIIKGGTISVTGPGSITITKDGSNGYYQFFTDGTPGSYTMTYSNPNGFSIAITARPPAATHIDPTSLDGSPLDLDGGLIDGWVQVGSKPNADTTALLDGSAIGNPYYLVFDIVGGDPWISDNNLPLDCDLPTGSIGDLVWKDLDKNGQYDAGSEVGVASVTVRLLEVTSPVGSTTVSTTVVSTTLTDSTGNYLFSNLPAGRYIVEFDKTSLPTDCALSPDYKKPGVPEALDSDADPATGRSPIVELVPVDPTKRDVLTVDAGLISTACPPAVCLPIVIQQIRGPRR